uniref:Fas ligand (TNF superfamily, member 6) n=1 Tax=Gasterosteus aculeatus aculeatus TaxID=481459 RepID=A0AAQ4P6T4_GASAC|nr:tumor necrosis factor ligand superfamily member 6 [Gasterosteus aculeatus aculeatus]
MSRDPQSYPFPQVFLVDGGGGPQHADQQPSLVPCWSFPPAQRSSGRRGKSRRCTGAGAALVVLLLFLLVFASLGMEAYQIHSMQAELRELRENHPLAESNTPGKQIALRPEEKKEDQEERAAAHVTGRIEVETFPQTLRWEPHAGRAFTSGAVAYRLEDGALQPNRSGLYHVYSRVELLFRDCSPSSSFVHSVFVRRAGRSAPLTLMEAHRAGFCSQQGGRAWTTESYLASALPLQKSDRVFVNVSHPKYLSHSHYGNFFGLYEV